MLLDSGKDVNDRTITAYEKPSPNSSDNPKCNRNLKTICRCILLRYLFNLGSDPLLNVGGLGSDDG